MRNYYLKDGNSIRGPYLLDDLKYQRVRPDTLVKIDQEGEWEPLAKHSDLSFLLQVQDPDPSLDKNLGSDFQKQGQAGGARKMALIVGLLVMLMSLGIALFVFFGFKG